MANDNSIKAIPTVYKGVQFRSRLEARWAVLFDNMEITWHYETEGYSVELEQGYSIRYLPDFKLSGGGVWCPDELFVEVKGDMRPEDALKISAFSKHFPLYVVGNIPRDLADIRAGVETPYGVPYYSFQTVDGNPLGAVLGIRKGGGWGLFGAYTASWSAMDEAKTRQAYALARMVHFEF